MIKVYQVQIFWSIEVLSYLYIFFYLICLVVFFSLFSIF
jgi:hypothetical protein